MKNINDCLLQVSMLLENTFNPVSKDGTWSIKHTINGNVLTLKYTTIMQYNDEHTLRLQVAKEREMAVQLLGETISKLRKDYKAKTSETLKTEVRSGADDIEIIHATAQYPRKVAYYRHHIPIVIG